jgi:hypothetical protein
MSFAVDVPTLDDALRLHDEDERLILLQLAYWLHDSWHENEFIVDRLHVRFRYASWLLAANIGMWMLALAVG